MTVLWRWRAADISTHITHQPSSCIKKITITTFAFLLTHIFTLRTWSEMQVRHANAITLDCNEWRHHTISMIVFYSASVRMVSSKTLSFEKSAAAVAKAEFEYKLLRFYNFLKHQNRKIRMYATKPWKGRKKYEEGESEEEVNGSMQDLGLRRIYVMCYCRWFLDNSWELDVVDSSLDWKLLFTDLVICLLLQMEWNAVFFLF